MSPFRVPSATYRIQFNLDFRFVDARELVPYLHELGISDLYASPRFKARRGSSHGYDVADPLRVNSELGTEREFEELVERLARYGMGLLLDIVPNHMSASSDNPWWMDVLENGPGSRYAGYFDINWHPPVTKARFLQENKVLLPILGDLYGRVLERQEFILKLDEHGFFVRYHQTRLPLDPKTYLPILERCREEMEELPADRRLDVSALTGVIRQVRRLPSRQPAEAHAMERRRKGREAIHLELWKLYHQRPEVRRALERSLREYNGVRSHPESFDRLHQLLAAQAYRLAYWKLAAEEINYRRFFDVSDLVGLRVEDPRVFQARHAQIVQLVRERKVSGLRVDHVDGLYDPPAYLRHLQAAIGPAARNRREAGNFYVVVEKVLLGEETLPEDWPVGGTTGYDFLNQLNGLFVDPRGLGKLEAAYRKLTGVSADFAEIRYRAKKQVIEELFAGELNILAHELARLAARDRNARDVPFSEYVRSLAEVAACLPVYRTYLRGQKISTHDRRFAQAAMEAARRRTSGERVGPPAFKFLARVLGLETGSDATHDSAAWRDFVMRWQQFTGPVMAKGLEDTALYLYFPLISLNEVGSEPGLGANPPAVFRAQLRKRQKRFPATLNATSTHDTKRSEDVRARINVLADCPDEWIRCLKRWSRWNRGSKTLVEGRPAPDANDEMLLYQTLIGAWPLREEELPAFRERLKSYLLKAAREAKAHTSWVNPRPDYERALVRFAESLLAPSSSNRFLKDFVRFQRALAPAGALNSLSQVLLKITAPGVPDFYQGSELWDFSLVDPDNRRRVDFRRRQRLLEELHRREAGGALRLAENLLAKWQNGRVKLFVTHKALNFRKAHADLFQQGDCVPLPASGRRARQVFAFARRYRGRWAVSVVPRCVGLFRGKRFPLGRPAWRTTVLLLPQGTPAQWVNVLTGESLKAERRDGGRVLKLARIFQNFPVALLEGKS